jgi:hypothetical protein
VQAPFNDGIKTKANNLFGGLFRANALVESTLLLLQI